MNFLEVIEKLKADPETMKNCVGIRKRDFDELPKIDVAVVEVGYFDDNTIELYVDIKEYYRYTIKGELRYGSYKAKYDFNLFTSKDYIVMPKKEIVAELNQNMEQGT